MNRILSLIKDIDRGDIGLVLVASGVAMWDVGASMVTIGAVLLLQEWGFI